MSGRYKAQLVEGSGNGYLRTACDYVHLNPVRAGLLNSEERLLAYPWSSFGYYLAAPPHRPGWVRVDRLMGEHGLGALRLETTLSVKQIAQRLHFGTPKSASFRLLTVMRTQTSTDPGAAPARHMQEGKIEA